MHKNSNAPSGVTFAHHTMSTKPTAVSATRVPDGKDLQPDPSRRFALGAMTVDAELHHLTGLLETLGLDKKCSPATLTKIGVFKVEDFASPHLAAALEAAGFAAEDVALLQKHVPSQQTAKEAETAQQAFYGGALAVVSTPPFPPGVIEKRTALIHAIATRESLGALCAYVRGSHKLVAPNATFMLTHTLLDVLRHGIQLCRGNGCTAKIEWALDEMPPVCQQFALELAVKWLHSELRESWYHARVLDLLLDRMEVPDCPFSADILTKYFDQSAVYWRQGEFRDNIGEFDWKTIAVWATHGHKFGVDVNARVSPIDPVLRRTLNLSVCSVAVIDGAWAAVRALVSAGADVTEVVNDDCWLYLLRRRPEIAHGLPPYDMSDDARAHPLLRGASLLMLATIVSTQTMVETLLECGADACAVNAEGRTAAQVALTLGDLPKAETLLCYRPVTVEWLDGTVHTFDMKAVREAVLADDNVGYPLKETLMKQHGGEYAAGDFDIVAYDPAPVAVRAPIPGRRIRKARRRHGSTAAEATVATDEPRVLNVLHRADLDRCMYAATALSCMGVWRS